MTVPARAYILLHESDPAECLAACRRQVEAAGFSVTVLDMRASASYGSYGASLNNAVAAQDDAAPILLVRADTVPEPGCLPRLLAEFTADETLGCLGCRVVSPAGRILSDGRAFINGRGFNEPGLRINEGQPEPPPQEEASFPAPTFVDAPEFSAVLIRHDAFDAAGGFDAERATPQLLLDDFCCALRVAGYAAASSRAATTVCYAPHGFPDISAAHPRHAELLAEARTLSQALLREEAPLWRARWGWHPLYPDPHETLRRFSHTPLCADMLKRLSSPIAEWPCAVDLCMVTWNSRAVLARCLDSLATTDYPAHLLTLWVADNGSTDGTPEWLESRAQSLPFALRLTRLPVNTGAVAALNLVMGQGTAPVLAKLDDDIHVPPHWLKALLRRFEERPFSGVVGAKILDDTPEGRIQCGPLLQPPLFEEARGESDHGQHDQVCRSLHVRGCCCLYRRDAFEAVGPLDIRFSPSQFDDLDHHLRFAEAGYEIIYDGGVAVRHKLSSGAYATISAMGNVRGNAEKLRYKWGPDTIGNMEIALTLSAEGRTLGGTPKNPELACEMPPADAELPADRILAPASPTAANVSQARSLFDALEKNRNARRAAGGVYTALTRQHLEEGRFKGALKAADTGLAFNPAQPELLYLFACAAHVMGDAAPAERALARARLLDPASADCPSPHPPEATASPAPRAVHRAAPDGPLAGLRLLLAAVPGLYETVDSALLPRIAGLAARQGAQVTHWTGRMADIQHLSGGPSFDVAHIFGLSPTPHLCVDLIKAVTARRVVLTPLLRDEAAVVWAEDVLPRLFLEQLRGHNLESLVDFLASDAPIYGTPRPAPGAPPPEPWSGYAELALDALRRADVLTYSHSEQKARIALAASPGALAALRCAPPLPEAATPMAQPDSGAPGAPPSVLTIGPLDPAGNLLTLLLAARIAGMPVVSAGRAANPQYRDLCATLAPEGSLFLDSVSDIPPRPYVYARPSMAAECPDYALSAAERGLPVVTAPNLPAAEVLGAAAHTPPPLDIRAIATALRAAAAQTGDERAGRILKNAARAAGETAVAGQLIDIYTG